MANILSWGKPGIEYVKLENGDLPSTPVWKAFPTPVENTTKLETEEGESKEAKVEGGEVIATRKNVSKYKLEFEIYETDDLKHQCQGLYHRPRQRVCSKDLGQRERR